MANAQSDSALEWKVLSTLGSARYLAGDYTAAIEALQKSIRLDPAHNYPGNFAFLVQAYLGLGRIEDAQAALGRLDETMQSSGYAANIGMDKVWREAQASMAGK